MEIKLKNTLTGKIETFEPLKEGHVSMYNCGPTVYDYAHIGNLRSYVFADVLRRMFEYNGYVVNQVINITDIGHLSGDGDSGDDKMTKALLREGKPMTLQAMREVADFYFEKFKEDLTALNIEMPEHFPFASDHVAEDIEIVEKLTEKGFTYNTSDGIYFDTAKFSAYGALGQTSSVENDKSRIGVNTEKKNQRDFALWKFSSPRHSREGGNPGLNEKPLGYDAPFGKGFPGWHIECSAMSRKYLGQPFDIHTGGIDHIPVHHNNEIAQSEVAYDAPLAHVWMHNAFLNMGGDKMAKSIGNFITLQTLKEKSINPLALRYLFLTAHYSTNLDFSWDALVGAETAWKRLKKVVQELRDEDIPEPSSISKEYTSLFIECVNTDINTPKALALVWDIIKDENITHSRKKKLILDFDRILGLELDKPEEKIEIPEEVQKLVDERNIARTEKNWQKSDELRDEIERLGFSVKDGENGTEIQKY